jgi:hypothetical protein
MSHQEDVASEKITQRGEVSAAGGASPRAVAEEMMAQREAVAPAELSQPTNLSGQIVLQRESLAKEIIEYLSKEIETVTNGMMVFRSKISFAVLVGPFLILGTLVYAAKGLRIATEFGTAGWIAIGIVFFCYLALAFLSGRIEEDGWRQCNEWRKLISALQKNPAVELDEKNVRKDKSGVDPVKWMKWSYLAACALMLLAFLSLLFVLSRVKATPVDGREQQTAERRES